MSSAHIGHDCVLEDSITLCNNVAVAGHARIMQGATLALNASVHQFKVVGSWVMVGMNTCLNKSIIIDLATYILAYPQRIWVKHRWFTAKQYFEGRTTGEVTRFQSIINNSSCF